MKQWAIPNNLSPVRAILGNHLFISLHSGQNVLG